MKDENLPRLSEILNGAVVPLEEREAKPKLVETPKTEDSLEIQIEDADYLIADVKQEETPKEPEPEEQKDRYQFPFRDPRKVVLASYWAIRPAKEAFEDLIIRTIKAIKQGLISRPPTGSFETGDPLTICVAAHSVDNGKEKLHIPKHPKHITFPQKLSACSEDSCDVEVWSAGEVENHPESLNLLGELIKSLDPVKYPKTKIVLQVREHFKGNGLSFEEIATKYFSKVTDTSKYDKFEEVDESLSFTAINEALKRVDNTRIAKFEEYQEPPKETAIFPQSIRTDETVYLLPGEAERLREDPIVEVPLEQTSPGLTLEQAVKRLKKAQKKQSKKRRDSDTVIITPEEKNQYHNPNEYVGRR